MSNNLIKKNSWFSINIVRLFPLLMVIMFLVVMSGAFFLLKTHSYKEQLISEADSLFQLLKKDSAKELVLVEKNNRSEETRWGDGWSLSGHRYTFTDIDGTKYTYKEDKLLKEKHPRD